MARVNVRPHVVIRMAGKAVRGSVAYEALALAKVTLRTVGEGVHTAEWQERAPVNLKDVRELKAAGRVAFVAARPESTLVNVLVAADTITPYRLPRLVAVDAAHGFVKPAKGEARGVVVESAGFAR